MNIKRIITVGVAGMAMGVMALDNVEVTDVKARQRYPWNGKVDIDFTLDSKPTEPYQMQVEVYDNVGKTNLPVKSVCTECVSVEANPCAVSKDTSRIVWDASKDLPNGFKCTNVLVTCRDARTIASDKLYCVITLSNGKMEYFNSIPAGGWTQEHKTSKMVFRHIPAGSFMMGSSSTEANRQNNESYHKVTLTKPYYISIFEMTESQYAAIKGTSLSSVSIMPKKVTYADARGADYGESTTYVWPNSSNVSSSSLAGIMRSRTGKASFDLPTEAQWEYAAKGDMTTALNTGYTSADQYMSFTGRYVGNVSDGKGDASSQAMTQVGCYSPNAYGLYDMLGNLREWCLDAWKDDLGTSNVSDPKGNSSIVVANVRTVKDQYSGNVTYHSTASRRVVKGGGYYDWHSRMYTNAYNHYHVGNEDKINQADATLKSCRPAYRTFSLSAPYLTSGECFYECNLEGVRLVFAE